MKTTIYAMMMVGLVKSNFPAEDLTQRGPPGVVFEPFDKVGVPAITKRAEAPAVFDRLKKIADPIPVIPIHLEQLVGYKNIPFSERDNGFVVLA